MRTVGRALAALFVMLRFIVVPAWIAGAVWVAVALPSIGGGGSGSLADLVPKSAPAVTAERISDKRFALPLLSRTVVVVRNPHGTNAQSSRWPSSG